MMDTNSTNKRGKRLYLGNRSQYSFRENIHLVNMAGNYSAVTEMVTRGRSSIKQVEKSIISIICISVYYDQVYSSHFYFTSRTKEMGIS